MSVAHKLIVYRKSGYRGWSIEYPKDNLLSSAKIHFDLELYEMNETDDTIGFTLKPDILTTHIYDFLVEQKALFSDEKIDDRTSEILKSGDYERIVSAAEEKRYDFQELKSSFYTAKGLILNMKLLRILYRGKYIWIFMRNYLHI